MNPYDYIHVALHGHFDNKLAVRYDFNASEDGMPRWEGSLPDPEAIVKNFMSARECYVMWTNEHGHYYGIITNDPLDSRAGRVMITIMVDNGDAITGRAVFSALSGLKKAFLEDRMMTDDAVRGVLTATGVPSKPLELPAWDFHNHPRPAGTKSFCYRTYLSTRELETVFSFPDQAEYRPYAYIVVITATASLRPGIAVDRLTAPVKRTYSVICPAGVTASATEVTEGEHLTLTFNKEGFNARKETVTVGTPSPYTRIEGSVLTIKAPVESGMGFTRKVRVNVRSSKGSAVNGYTMSVNDRPVNTMNSFIELTEVDLQPGKKVEIQVASNNFKPLKQIIDPMALGKDPVVELTLEPLEEGIILRLDFGEGRIFDQQISLEKNAPEYSQLRSGSFHGFRAHRQAGQGEIYNIDVRSASKPVTPSFENAAVHEDTGNRRRVVPTFERATTTTERKPIEGLFPRKDEEADRRREEAAREEESRREAARREKEEAKAKKKQKEDRDNDDDDERPSRGLIITCIIVIAVAITLGVWYIWPSSDKADAVSELPATSTQARGEVETPEQADAEYQQAKPAAAQAQQAAKPADDGAADADYLNNNNVWKRSDLKTESGRALFDAIAAGNIQAIVSNPYFATPGRATNKRANQMADFIWNAYGTKSQPKNEEKLKEAVKDGSFDVSQAWDQTSRVQPKEGNTAKRPGK